MISKAHIKYLKISARKLRMVLPLVRNKPALMALSILENTNKKAAGYAYKAIHSAIANARRFPNVDESHLFVSRIFADAGPTLKRFRARAMGMAAPIRKRSSHLTVELDVKSQGLGLAEIDGKTRKPSRKEVKTAGKKPTENKKIRHLSKNKKIKNKNKEK